LLDRIPTSAAAEETLAEQADDVIENIRRRSSALETYCYLSAVEAQNEALFYRVVLDHLEEVLPIVYTPTVGEACLEWSRIQQRPRGLHIAATQHRGRVAELLRTWPHPVRIVVVTDGGRILGLGDLGANGMAIPIAKRALYTACAGVSPDICLPVSLDVGTDNVDLRTDPPYIGERQPRMTGAAYDEFIDEFITAVQTVFPGAIVHFEDFNTTCAFRLLDRYRGQICCFNGDVQGTGAVGLAGLYSACRITGTSLAEQRILFVGAGEACLGIGALVTAAMQRDGMPEVTARHRCLFMDSKGLVVTSRADLPPHKRVVAQERTATSDLVAVIEDFRPTALIGACAQPGIFTEPVLRKLARVNERPIVFALSNPTSKCECTAEHAYMWTDGRVIFASGSPFAPVTVAGHTHTPAQGNNSYVFPGIGLGLLMSGATRATDEMFLAAARALAGMVSNVDLQEGRVFPGTARMRKVALAVSVAVAGVAYRQGHASRTHPPDLTAETLRAMYVPGDASVSHA
jgi:malate dehydrogenase (oxaloacetate-decarboxylating)(NADP+)